MNDIIVFFIVSITLLTSCAQLPAHDPAAKDPAWVSVADSQDLSDATKAKLQAIEKDYGLMSISVMGNQIAITTGMLRSGRMKEVQDAVLNQVGTNYTVYLIIK